jgi:hypothetical protein
MLVILMLVLLKYHQYEMKIIDEDENFGMVEKMVYTQSNSLSRLMSYLILVLLIDIYIYNNENRQQQKKKSEVEIISRKRVVVVVEKVYVCNK